MRAFRLPNGYAKGHWLHNYKHGFVPRGLVGELIYPVLQHKSPEEVNGILALLSWSVLALLSAVLIYGAWKLLQHQVSPWRRGVAVAILGVFATSPFAVMAGHLTGYFDQIVQLLGVVGLYAIFRRRYVVTGLICALAIFVHEIFVVTVMPSLFFATLLNIQGEKAKAKVKALAGLLVVPVLVSLLILKVGAGSSDVSALTQDITRYGVMEFPFMSTEHLSQGFSEIWSSMVRTTLLRARRPDVFPAIGPGLTLLLIALCGLRFGAGRVWLRIIAVLTSLAPLMMLVTVWDGDSGRMAAITFYCGFCNAAALGWYTETLGGTGAKAQTEPPASGIVGRVMRALVLMFAVGVSLWQMRHRVILMDFEKDGETLLGVRRIETPAGYRCDQLLFRNSDFELGHLVGWSQSGTAFEYQPIDRQPARWKRRPWNQGQYWIGTFDRRSINGAPLIQGDLLTGELTSEPFRITRDKINFLVAGGDDLASTYVALEIDGQERFRVSGLRSNHMRRIVWGLGAYVGHLAKIKIVDQSSGGWGNIVADGFCYVDE